MLRFFPFFISHKNNRVKYYLGCFYRELYPRLFKRKQLSKRLSEVLNYNKAYLKSRLDYYNKLSTNIQLSSKAIKLSDLPFPERARVYYFDTVEFTSYFQKDLKANFLFGDITNVPDEPALTKSRPILGDNTNSVILKLEKMRHFMFVKYDIPYTAKKDFLIWRGVTKIPHRIRFMEKYFNHPLCDLGKINTDGEHEEWIKPKISINKHLAYKFILCIEGNDVATNLKWVMSSNSIAVMPKPTYETWYMEGTLIPDFHYILIKDDFSDLEERLQYFISNTDKALQLISNAHAYINQFKDEKREELLSLLVLEKYFIKTNQMQQISSITNQ